MLMIAKQPQPSLIFCSCKRWSRATQPDRQHAIQTVTSIIPQAQTIKNCSTSNHTCCLFVHTQCMNSPDYKHSAIPCCHITWSSASFTDLGRNDPEAGRTNSSQRRQQLPATWATPRYLVCRQPACQQWVKVTSHLARHGATASSDDFIRRITNTFNRRPWRHWHPQQIIHMYFHIHITSPQIPVAILWMRT